MVPEVNEILEVVEEARKEVRYIVTDFSYELIVSKFKEHAEAEGDIYVPDYQRNLAWTTEQKSYFIESLILRVPCPPVFLYDVDGKLEIVDGSQRIRSLVAFSSDGFTLVGLEKLDILNGSKFSELPVPIQRRLNNTPIRSFVLDQGTDESTRIDLFRRLNTSGKPMAVSSLTVFVVDASGREVLERRVDSNGVAPSVKSLAFAPLKPGEARLVFNPFPVIPADIGAKAVRVEVELSPSEGRGASITGAAKATFRAPPASALKLMLPLAGKVWVWDGHDLLAHHRRWDYSNPDIMGFGFTSNAMRYSYDLVRVDAEGRRVVGDATRNENHLSFGLPVRAPADGVVVEIENGQTDDGKFDPATFRDRPNLVLGNHVVIRHGDGTFSILGHVKQGSVTVKAGDAVKAGQTVAAVGNSGTSMFPHLHYQLMDGPTFASEGVPSAFSGLTRLRGSIRAPLPAGAIDSGDVVESRD